MRFLFTDMWNACDIVSALPLLRSELYRCTRVWQLPSLNNQKNSSDANESNGFKLNVKYIPVAVCYPVSFSNQQWGPRLFSSHDLNTVCLISVHDGCIWLPACQEALVLMDVAPRRPTDNWAMTFMFKPTVQCCAAIRDMTTHPHQHHKVRSLLQNFGRLELHPLPLRISLWQSRIRTCLFFCLIFQAVTFLSGSCACMLWNQAKNLLSW